MHPCALRTNWWRATTVLLCASRPATEPELPPVLASIPHAAMPASLAVVMDGNARWAKAANLPASAGHAAGVDSLRSLVSHCLALDNVEVLTVYAFSSENWSRPPAEVDSLMTLIRVTLEAEAEALYARGVRLSFCGDLERLPEALRSLTRDLAARPAPSPQRLHFCIALSYGGQQEIARAARKLAERAAAGELPPSDITPHLLDATLREQGGPPQPPDLLLRTGGQHRLSNFLLFESAYAEIVVDETLWPDFGATALARCLEEYAGRQRTFGVRESE